MVSQRLPIQNLGQHTAAWKLYKVKLLALLWPCNVRGDEGVHKCLKVWPPPLRKCVADLPLIIDTLARELCADWCEALVQPRLEPLNLVVLCTEVVAGATWRQQLAELPAHVRTV